MTSGNAGPILGLAHTTLAVENLDAAVAAYEVLFAQPRTRRGTAGGFDLACFPWPTQPWSWLRRMVSCPPLECTSPTGPPGQGHRPER